MLDSANSRFLRTLDNDDHLEAKGHDVSRLAHVQLRLSSFGVAEVEGDSWPLPLRLKAFIVNE